MATVTRSIPVSNATWVYQTTPAKNYHRNEELGFRTSSGADAHVLLYCQLPAKLTDPLTTLISAKLRLYAKGTYPGTSLTYTVKRLTSRVPFSQATWNNKPTAGATSATLAASTAAEGDLVEIDVAPLLATGLVDDLWHGFQVQKSGTTLRYLFSPFTGELDYRPTLELEWSTKLAAPTDLSPAGGRSVSISHPVLRALDGWPEDADRGVDAFQAQIHSSDSWGAPLFDTGTVATTAPEVDLSATAYGGVTNGQTRWWRCRVRTDGQWSAWSAGVSFMRTDKPTLTLTNPAASPNNFVSEWTPPFAFTFTGLDRFRVGLAHSTRPDVVLHDSGVIRSGTGVYTPPTGILTREDTDYIIDVRAWDAVDREATPGDPTYRQATRTFRFAEDGTPNPVTSLVAAADTLYPFVNLTWSRSTAPDKFTVLRKLGADPYEVVEDDLIPSQLTTGGTGYAYTDRGLRPGKTYTYKVQAVVNGQTSNGNPTATAQTSTVGIWLTEPDSDNTVFIAGPYSVDLGHTETSAVYTPPDSRNVAIIWQAQRGRSGTITGRLVTHGNVTAAEWETRLLAIRDRPGRVCRLALGDLSMRGIPRAISTTPEDNPAGTVAVSFEFHELTT